MRYLVFGAGGMAGHIIASFLKEKKEDVVCVARKKLQFDNNIILDVRDLEQVKKIIYEGNYDIIINCIGLLNKNAEDNISDAIFVNSFFPHFLADCVVNKKTRVFHMSTDCVFSGKRGGYLENDNPDGETVYDKTKALGELNDSHNLTFRNSIIGPDVNENGIGLFNWFMKQEGAIQGYDKSIWTGVTTLTLAKAMYAASKQDICGIYNLVNNKKISKYELLSLFNKYTLKNLTINKVDGIIHDKSLRCTRNDFDFEVPSYEKQVEEMVEWIRSHQELYPFYDLK